MEIQWNKLKETADQESGFQFSPPPGEAISTRVSWKDRYWSSVLSGGVTTLLVSVVLMAWMSKDALSLAAVLGSAPLIAWFCRPLTTRKGVGSVGRLTLTLPLLLVFSATAMLLPTVGLYFSHGDPLHKEILAFVFQRNLESVLSWPAVLSVALLVTLCGRSLHKAGETRPWLEPSASSKFSLGWRTVVLLGAALTLVWLQSQTVLREDEKAWLTEQEAFYQSRPFRTFPPKSEEEFWRQQIVALNNGRDYSLLLIKDHPPLDREELDAAESYMFRALPSESLSAYDRSLAMLEFVQINLQLRPNGNRAYLDKVLKELVKLVTESDFNQEQLASLKSRTHEVSQEVFDRSTELNQEVYRDLWAENEDFELSIGWYSPESVLSWQPEKKMGWTYNGVAPPTSMYVLGMEMNWSPTRWLKRYQQVQMTREWLESREELTGLTVAQQVSNLGQRRESLQQLDTRERRFWDSLEREDQVTRESELLQQAQAVLESRLQGSEAVK